MTGRDRELILKLMGVLERMQLDRYVEYVSNKKRMILNNILYGICRGLGFTIGFTVLGGGRIVELRGVFVENIPLIGGFLAEVIRAIEARI